MSRQTFRMHILGMPHTIATDDYEFCAFTQKTRRFAKMMHQRGHYIIYYGVEGADIEADEVVPVVTREFYDRFFGDYDNHTIASWNFPDAYMAVFNPRMTRLINERVQPTDLILAFGGASQEPVCNGLKCGIKIEPSIGYPVLPFLKYRIFESYAIYNADAGQVHGGDIWDAWLDAVIPSAFDISTFECNTSRENRDYFLYIGRCCDAKGIQIAISTCRLLGIKLILAGQLADNYLDYDFGPGVEYVGPVNAEQRNKLMRGAIAVFMPSQYIEPMGWVLVESLLSGTPVISSDRGALQENNIDGVTGYRCRTLDDYVRAAIGCTLDKISPEDCRKQGENFSFDVLAPKYEKYFAEVVNAETGNGWYHLSDEVIDILSKYR